MTDTTESRTWLPDGFVHPGSAWAGEQFPQANIGGRWSDDIHGVGWRLITDAATVEVLDPELAGWFRSIGGVVIPVDDGAPALTDWLDAHDVHWVLQRPDFHIYGTAVDAERAAALVEDLRRHLTAATP